MSAGTPVQACDGCLRRAHLVGFLAGRIAGLLGRRSRAPGLLSLDEQALVAAVTGADPEPAYRFLEAFDPARATRRLGELGLHVVCLHAEAYPAGLRQLGDPPPVLFSQGSGALLGALVDAEAVAIVGARHPSGYGTEMAYGLGRGLGAAGVPVVSGLALGIDATAHRGCLDAQGRAVAVLPSGIDVVYPRTNRALHTRIRGSGLILSELPPGVRPFRWSFPARNRIMAALSATTVVVEAAQPSGSLITAEFAADLGRTVAAVPGQATSRKAAGTNALLKAGALMVTRTEDVLDELFGATPPTGPVEGEGERLDAAEAAVLDAVEDGLGIDAMCAAAGLPVREIRALLVALEGRGLLATDGLGRYRRTMREVAAG